MKNSSN